ncbi:ADP-ribose pyrophosphatase, partial [Pseudomonas lundensis]|nr:ADP-ribose pyrophosphatase [Pseudomonas lundensis]
MKYYEKTIHSEEIFEGKIINVRLDDVLLVNGKTSKREIVHHNGGVAILPMLTENKIFLVRQF